eukprot:TRINITY_DN16250_c0_g1_i1.p1 TRINITY_DN16250_c0_g1~~TRINITY_DN16250_c0_g1_i1.p1  ORF type:complete len:419 (+),score=60.62 TRINITY_DN16250_c0_g1_i1:97-1353(+)
MSDSKGMLYKLMVKQLLYDGYQDAAFAVSQGTMTSVPITNVDGDKLSKLVQSATYSEQVEEQVGAAGSIDDWNTVYSYFRPSEKLVTRHIAQQSREIRSIRFSPDGKYVISGDAGGSCNLYLASKMMSSNGEVKFASTSAIARVFKSPQSVEDAQFHPTQPVIHVGCRDGGIRTFHYARPRLRMATNTLQDEYAIRALSIHPMGQHLISGTEHPVVRIWDIENEKVFRGPDDLCDIINPNAGMVNCVDFSPDLRTFASGSSDGTVKVWDPSAANWVVTPITHCHSGAEVTSVQYSKTGFQLLTAGKDSMVRLFDTRTFKCLFTFGRAKQVQSKILARFTAHEECIAFIGHHGDRLTLIDRNTLDTIDFPHTTSCQIRAMMPSPTSPFIATGDDGRKVRLWAPNAESNPEEADNDDLNL